jgi:hypothetical protein
MIREVVVVGHPGVLGMELTGACDIFALSNTLVAEAGRPPAYRVTVASMGGGPLALAGGLQLAGTADLAGLRRPIDTLVVVGGPSVVVASLEHDDVRAFDEIDESVLVVDSSRPAPGQDVSQGFGLSDSAEGVPQGRIEEAIDPLQRRLVS